MDAIKIEVDFRDYLTDDDVRRIVSEEFRDVVRAKVRADFERILTNAAYELVRREVDAVFDGGMAEFVKEKAVGVIKELSAFTVFRRPDAWDKEASKGWVHLQSAMDEAKPQIAERVSEVIAGMDVSDMRYLIESKVSDVLTDRIFGCNALAKDGES